MQDWRYIAVCLLASLAVIVLMGVTYRKLGISMVWYDEVASIALAWLTYYGAALAALNGQRNHLIALRELFLAKHQRGRATWR